jgi:hypothetical protein
MENDRLNERPARLEGQVSRLLTALCGALGMILVFIFTTNGNSYSTKVYSPCS